MKTNHGSHEWTAPDTARGAVSELAAEIEAALQPAVPPEPGELGALLARLESLLARCQQAVADCQSEAVGMAGQGKVGEMRDTVQAQSLARLLAEALGARISQVRTALDEASARHGEAILAAKADAVRARRDGVFAKFLELYPSAARTIIELVRELDEVRAEIEDHNSANAKGSASKFYVSPEMPFRRTPDVKIPGRKGTAYVWSAPSDGRFLGGATFVGGRQIEGNLSQQPLEVDLWAPGVIWGKRMPDLREGIRLPGLTIDDPTYLYDGTTDAYPSNDCGRRSFAENFWRSEVLCRLDDHILKTDRVGARFVTHPDQLKPKIRRELVEYLQAVQRGESPSMPEDFSHRPASTEAAGAQPAPDKRPAPGQGQVGHVDL